jgi:RecJ-like exonuclease
MPDKWVICPVCRGDGSHVNPNIDAHGLTREDFSEDPDFAEDYMKGTYDITCQTCQGTGKVRGDQQEQIIQGLIQAAEDRRLAAMEDGNFESYSVAGDWRYGS